MQGPRCDLLPWDCAGNPICMCQPHLCMETRYQLILSLHAQTRSIFWTLTLFAADLSQTRLWNTWIRTEQLNFKSWPVKRCHSSSPSLHSRPPCPTYRCWWCAGTCASHISTLLCHSQCRRTAASSHGYPSCSRCLQFCRKSWCRGHCSDLCEEWDSQLGLHWVDSLGSPQLSTTTTIIKQAHLN